MVKHLQFWIEIDMANIHRLKAGIHAFEMPAKYTVNGKGHGGRVQQWITRAPSLEIAMINIKDLADYLTAQLH